MADPKTIRVVSAVADSKKVLFYLEDGTQLTINQGDPRLQALLDKIIPLNARGEVAIISLENFSIYNGFEEKTNGIVKFFKMARKKFKEFLNDGPKDEPAEELPSVVVPAQTAVGNPYFEQPLASEAPKPVDDAAERERITREQVAKQVGRIAKVKAELQPIVADAVADDETVVAVIGDTVIGDVEKIKPIIAHSLKHNSEKSVQNLLTRLSAIIADRQHSVEDVFRFLEKGDLPLTENGDIIAYKILSRRDGYYVDCHSGLVKQKVGSIVQISQNLINMSRGTDCAAGLHIARRGYIGQFGGDVCVLAIVRPEDVMVVPHNDANKVRVSRYTIISELSNEAFMILKQNKHMTDDEESLRAVYDAIKGIYPAPIETVTITGHKGTGVNIAAIDATTVDKVIEDAGNTKIATAIDAESEQGTSMAPKDINKQVNAEYEKHVAEKAEPVKEEAPAAKPKPAPKAKVAVPKAKKPSTKKDVAIPKKPSSKASKAVPKPVAKKEPKAVTAKAPKPSKPVSKKPEKPTKPSASISEPKPKRSVPKNKPKASESVPSTEKLTNIIEGKDSDEVKKPIKKAKITSEVNEEKVSHTKVEPVKTNAVTQITPAENDLSFEQREALRLVRTGTQVVAASKITGIGPSSIQRLIKKYGK